MKRCFDVWCFFREFPAKNGALFGLVILLMEEIPRQLIGSLSQERFWHSRWCGFLPSTVQWPLYWFASKLSGTTKNMIQFDSRALLCEKMVVANPLNSSLKKHQEVLVFLLKISPHLKNINKKKHFCQKVSFHHGVFQWNEGFLPQAVLETHQPRNASPRGMRTPRLWRGWQNHYGHRTDLWIRRCAELPGDGWWFHPFFFGSFDPQKNMVL